MTKQQILKKFRERFCNDHNGEIRFLRSVFYDEKDGAEQILSFLLTSLDELEKSVREEMIREIREKIDKLLPDESICMDKQKNDLILGRKLERQEIRILLLMKILFLKTISSPKKGSKE